MIQYPGQLWVLLQSQSKPVSQWDRAWGFCFVLEETEAHGGEVGSYGMRVWRLF